MSEAQDGDSLLTRSRWDPLTFVRGAFRWGEADGSLAHETGPDAWQEKQLREIGEALGDSPRAPVMHATVSGHGVGKSALVAWLILWGLMTLKDTRGVVTANTEGQLRTKTWAELAKWRGLLQPDLQAQVVLESSSIRMADRDSAKTWRIDAVPWSEHNPEAFAGLHNAGKRVLLLFDEASAIPDIIWDTAEGATTDAGTEIVWCVFGNPTRNTGRFREAVKGRFRHLWSQHFVDARKVTRTNKARLNQWIEAYGEDSDFARVRVKGEFPRAASNQFIETDVVQEARRREPGYIAWDPIVFGVDVARFGDDASVLAIRRGRDARTFPWKVWRKLDTMAVADFVFEQAKIYKPAAIFVDVSGGLGAGVADRLRYMQQPGVNDVQFGGAGGEIWLGAGTTLRAANKSAAMWMQMREWLKVGAIPDDDALETDLTGREYGFSGPDSAIQLEAKDDMKRRGLASPDLADALALTFAHPMGRAEAGDFEAGRAGGGGRVVTEYDIHADLKR